jgi:hypothetical protein
LKYIQYSRKNLPCMAEKFLGYPEFSVMNTGSKSLPGAGRTLKILLIRGMMDHTRRPFQAGTLHRGGYALWQL